MYYIAAVTRRAGLFSHRSLGYSRAPHTPLSSTFSPRQHPYPNPGFLGSSSHTAIFEHISRDHAPSSSTQDPSDNSPSLASFAQIPDDDSLLQGADVLRRILRDFPLTAMKDLVLFWLARGANLALAEPFVKGCTEGVSGLFSSLSHDENWHLSCAKQLLINSRQPLKFTVDTNFSSFQAQFLNENFRWESLAIFFLAVGRASVDITFFPTLYMTTGRRHALRGLCTKLSDCALEIALSLDCLNDIQLVLQYENFIMHSFVDGDHSYRAWRRMGDVISSVFALGYHEDIDTKADAPFYLTQLRKTTFARIYSADKNVAIFLGRPPRMTKRYCHFQIPSSFPDTRPNIDFWDPEAKASYIIETRWSALCASLKEEILELARDKNNETYAQEISDIQTRAEAQWEALPPRFQLQGSLLHHDIESPFEGDFLISARLNHLHVLFLLRLLLSNTLAEPDAPIVTIAGEMLSLVVEVILMRDQIINSGTGLVWKASQ
ncbi:hypothetical protein ANO14919_091650 [Xylariales sp. No.14919]|nr:hypothetical protein ANO14919_091650 [Xylariales sp. No.14919]